MRKSFTVVSGTGIRDYRASAPTATEAFRLVVALMKFRRPGVRIEDARGNPVTFFQLKTLAASEMREKQSRA